MKLKRKPTPKFIQILEEIKNHTAISARQLAKKFGIGPVRMMKKLGSLNRKQRSRLTDEYRQVGDGKGQPSQELVYSYRKKKDK